MSDIEEPPTKMSKYEEYLEGEGEEGMEEGQEEWLSEGVLTDDDYIQAPEQDQNESNLNSSQEDAQETTLALQESLAEQNADTDQGREEPKTGDTEQNIEEQLNNLESTTNGEELPDNLDAFLIRKTDGKVLETKAKEDSQANKKPADDGNDTDDLLRMLGEGDQKSKKKTLKMVKSDKNQDPDSSDDDDEFIYERSKVKTLKLAKNALIKRTPATKAEPEDMSDGDDETEQSSDDGSTVQRMFDIKNKADKVKSQAKAEPAKKIVKHVVQVNTSFNKNDKPELKTKPMTNQKSILKSTPQRPNILSKQLPKSVEVKTPAPFKPMEKVSKSDKLLKMDPKGLTSRNEEFDEIIDEEEFLEDDDIDLDEQEFGEDSEDEETKQRIMRPERMDEEVPSDGESHSEDGSLYDELPSSDSEDLDDWFSLDIRAERAGDYLPLLGSKARELLLAERGRVSARVGTLRHSLSALTDSARRQADQLRAAAMALAEIDDTLRAA